MKAQSSPRRMAPRSENLGLSLIGLLSHVIGRLKAIAMVALSTIVMIDQEKSEKKAVPRWSPFLASG